MPNSVFNVYLIIIADCQRVYVPKKNISYGDKVEVYCTDKSATSAYFSINGESTGSCYESTDCSVATRLKSTISISWNTTSNSAVMIINSLTSDMCGKYGCTMKENTDFTQVKYTGTARMLHSFHPYCYCLFRF